MEKVKERVGKVRNYGPTSKDLEDERRQAEVRLREKDEASRDEAEHKKEEEERQTRQQEERVFYMFPKAAL